MTTMDRRRLDGRVAFVSAAGRGLGRAIAIGLAQAGAKVAVNSYGEETTAATADAVKAVGGEALAIVGDATDPVRILSAIEETLDHFGAIDVLVNNVGAAPKSAPAPEEHALAPVAGLWDAMYSQNLRATVLTCEAVAPHMIERGNGRIVNISSIAGKTTLGARFLKNFAPPAYGAMKAALSHYTTTLADLLGPHGITVNAVLPGIVYTDAWRTLSELAVANQEAFKGQDPREWFLGIAKGEYPEIFDRTPMEREQTEEDIADAVAFLASDGAANVTGQSLIVDGGMVKT